MSANHDKQYLYPPGTLLMSFLGELGCINVSGFTPDNEPIYEVEWYLNEEQTTINFLSQGNTSKCVLLLEKYMTAQPQ